MDGQACVPIDLQSIRSTVSTNTGVDTIVLALMFVGLWRFPETRAGGKAGLVRVLWAQVRLILDRHLLREVRIASNERQS